MTAMQAPAGTGAATMEDLYARAEKLDVTPGWVKRDKPIFWKEPRTSFVPVRWSYADIRAALEMANDVVPMELAERRNLVLRNPFPGNNFETTRSFACAYQAILPGEMAPSHRHAAHALRVILDAKGTFSVVDGQKTPMESGDVVLTPGGCWHGHGHEGDDPAFWLDGLDIPLTHLLEPMFIEDHPQGFEPVTSVAQTSRFRFSADDIARGLDTAPVSDRGIYGRRITLETPDMPDMGLTVQRLESGSRTRRSRSTANRVFVIMSGSGRTTVGEKVLDWQRGDTLVAPIWHHYAHEASADSVIFELSDEPLMRFTRYYREELD